jgi:HlyD family secretion protein
MGEGAAVARRRAGWLLAALLGVGALAVAIPRARGDAEGEWATVERRDLERSVAISGLLEATSSADLRPPQVRDVYNFTISFMAPEGSELRSGDPALGFDASQLDQKLIQARADLAAAEKNLDKRRSDLTAERERARLQAAEAQANARRAQLQSDVPAEVVANQDLARARIDRELADDEVRHHQAAIERLERRERVELLGLSRQRDYFAGRVAALERDLERLTVRAPRPGVLVYKSNQRGEKKKVGDSVWWGEALAQVPDLNDLIALAEVAEVDAGGVALGQAAALRLDAFPDRIYPARVVEIHRAVQRRSGRDQRRVMRIELALEQVDTTRMRPGMRFTGELTLERLAGALVVPLAAVAPRAGRPAVLVDGPLGVGWVEPTLGRRTAEWVEVVGGLEVGARVLIRPESFGS